MLVVVFHLNQQVNWSWRDAYWVLNFHYFVVFFFVLSGFVIAASAERQIRSGDGVGPFLVRRFGRIYPLHLALFAVLAGYAGLRALALGADHAFDGGIYSRHGLVTNLLLLQGIGFENHFTWNFPSWSISAEFWTYVIFALIWRFGGKAASWIGWALLLVCPALLFLTPRQHVLSWLTLATSVYGFAAGVAAHQLYRLIGAKLAAVLAQWRLATLIEAAATAPCVAFMVARAEHRQIELAPLLFALVVFAFALEAGALSRLFRSAPIAVLGALSYSIYMTHAVLILLAAPAVGWLSGATGLQLTTLGGARGLWAPEPWMGDLVMAAGLILVVGVSVLTYRGIEEPGRALGRRLAARWSARSQRMRGAISGEPVV